MLKQAQTCDLCGMAIKGEPVVKEIAGERHTFCCNGCARAYQQAHDAEMLAEVQSPKAQKSKATKNVFKKGKEDTAYFSMQGMWCAGCAAAAENVLKNQEGVQSVDISFAAERGRINFDPERVDINRSLEKLDKLGYRARVLGDIRQRSSDKKQENTLLQLITALAFGMQVMFLYLTRLYPLYNQGQFTSTEIRNFQYAVWVLSTPVLFIGGISFIKGAWRALLARTATMDTLVAMGTFSAYFYSVYITITVSGETYFDSVAMITTFIMIGRYLEAIGGSRARKDIRHLLDLQPEKAWRKSNGEWQQVKVMDLEVGDTILVKSGERVPIDAEIINGHGSLNEAVLTGESLPVEKGPGSKIYAGTLLVDNAIQGQITQTPQSSRLAEITQIVEETLSHKPPIQRMADKASAYFAVGILVIAILTLGGWLFAGNSISHAILTAVAVLVVACPCALGLATPLALTVTLGNTTRAGILVRNPVALETAAEIQRLVLDKTGTLTLGQLHVEKVQPDPNNGLSSDELLCAAASVDQFSEHPIARAIVAACTQELLPAENFQVERGRGVSALVVGGIRAQVKVGSQHFLAPQDNTPVMQKAHERGLRGESVIWISWDNHIKGFISLRDQPNETAKEAIDAIKKLGIIPVVLSGDSIETTRSISEEVGLETYQGNVMPAKKAEQIKHWQERGEQVAMVGDGVNDAPALAQADISVTVAGGTAVAGETSDILLMRKDLNLIPWFIRQSKRTRRIIRQNLGWAFAYNLVAIPLAAFGVISPVIAAITMATSSLLVVGNSLRLKLE
jgi:heavy metal translocating P-type ATPase